MMTHSRLKILTTLFVILTIPLLSYTQEPEDTNPFITIEGNDGVNTHFLLHLDHLPGFFERAYLLELLFNDHTVVVMNTSISGDTLEMISDSRQDNESIIKNMESYRLKALKAGDELPDTEKEALLKKYEKYR